MLVPDIQKNKINMEKVMYDIIENILCLQHDLRMQRRLLSKRWHLPLGSWRPSKAYETGLS